MDEFRDEDDEALLPTLIRSLETISYELGRMERAIATSRDLLVTNTAREIVRRRTALQQDADALLALVCDSRLEDVPN